MNGRAVELARSGAVTLLLGAVVGAVLLGVGGRVVMWVFALATSRAPVFSVRGSLSVVLGGAIAGALGGVLLAVVHRLLPARIWLRGLVFAGLCYAVASPGLRPPQPLVFALFAPLFLGYGVLLVQMDERQRRSTM